VINGRLKTGPCVVMCRPAKTRRVFEGTASTDDSLVVHLGILNECDWYFGSLQLRVKRRTSIKSTMLWTLMKCIQLRDINYSAVHPAHGVLCIYGGRGVTVALCEAEFLNNTATGAKRILWGLQITDTIRPDVLIRPKQCCGFYLSYKEALHVNISV